MIGLLTAAVALILITAQPSALVRAADSIAITGMSFIAGATPCVYVVVNVSAVGPAPGDPPADLRVFRNGAQVGSASFPLFPGGSFSEYVPVDANPGDQITATVTLGGLSASSGPLVCPGGSTGGGSTESGGTTSSAGSPPTTSAAGDSRLGYSADEYYTVYCAYDQLEVWRGIPTGQLLATVGLRSLLDLSIGASTVAAAGGVTVTRQSADSYVVSGANGNLAPAAGSKAFSMAECISRNGGEPPAAPASAGAGSGTTSPEPTDTDLCERPESARLRICYTSDAAWCADTNYSDPDCAPYNFSRYLGLVLEGIFQCWSLMMAGLSATIAGMVVMVKRRDRWW